MPTDHGKRQASYGFLCATPFIAFGAAAARPLRSPGVYHVIGGVLFAAISTAAWSLGARGVRADVQSRRLLALAGTLLLTPFAMVALFWVGIGGPWAASAAENQMRYLVLIAMALAATGGFVVLKEALSQASERLHSTLGFARLRRSPEWTHLCSSKQTHTRNRMCARNMRAETGFDDGVRVC